jgi:hypothetical protein
LYHNSECIIEINAHTFLQYDFSKKWPMEGYVVINEIELEATVRPLTLVHMWDDVVSMKGIVSVYFIIHLHAFCKEY